MQITYLISRAINCFFNGRDPPVFILRGRRYNKPVYLNYISTYICGELRCQCVYFFFSISEFSSQFSHLQIKLL